MQRHPVQFTLPSLPVPEGHRVAERAVVEVVAQREAGLVALPLLHGRQHVGQLGLHLVPAEVNARMVFQIPVDAHGDVHPRVAAHHHATPGLVQLEEVAVGFLHFNFEFPRGPSVYALQQVVYRCGL